MTRTAPNPNSQIRSALMFLAGLLACLLAATPAWSQDGYSGYSYVRTVEGYANLESEEDGSLEAVENQPVIPGDNLIVGTSSLVEVVLADGTVLRVGGSSTLRFDTLAATPDTADASTRIFLAEGEVQVVLGPETNGAGPLELETGNSTLYLEAPGQYVVNSTGYDRTMVAVREGFAEAQTDRGSSILRSGEAGYIDGTEWASVEIAAAPSRSQLEAWGEELNAEAQLAEMPYLEPDMRYRAARMANYGAWVQVDDRWGWRPRVNAGWRPYVDGAWRYTPSGLTWISNEPWGWVPSHYGSWDLVPGYGWTWFAGSYYSPASVYWYWGPTHVGWVPAGYYTSFYSARRHVVPRFGVYGWAGGDWGFFVDWTFCPTRYFGRGRYDRYFRSGYDVGRHASYREIPRGVIATDTRSLRRDVWGEPDRIANRLIAADSRLSSGSLPDVTDFVARRKEVRPEIADIVRPQEVATLRSLGRSASSRTRAKGVRDAKVGDRTNVLSREGKAREGKARLGRPSVERRTAPATQHRDVTRRRSVEAPKSVDAPRREVLNRGTYGRPTVEQTESERSQVIRRGLPRSDRGAPGQPPTRLGATKATDSARQAPTGTGDDRTVVRRVIEQMRSRQGTVPAPPSAESTSSSSKSRATSSQRSRPSTSRQGAPSRSSSSRARSSSDRSRSSRARSSSKPPQRKSAKARSGRRKPPGD